MSGREWSDGQVAVVTLISRSGHRDEYGRCFWDSFNGQWVSAKQGRLYPGGQDVEVRPLAVIDPEDRKQVARLRDALYPSQQMFLLTEYQQALREFANPTPPKPAEPTGLGAVVEDADGERWVRGADVELGGGVWLRELFIGGGSPLSKQYAAVNAVRVLSEGVTQ